MNDAMEGYHRLAHGPGYAVLREWTCIRVTGADRASFLNNLCTNEIVHLRPGQGREAFFTDVKGHILAHVMLLCRPEEMLLWTVPQQGESLTRHLDKYIIREEVTVQDISADVQLVVVFGEGLGQVIGMDPLPEQCDSLSSRTASVAGVEMILAKCDWFGPAAVGIQAPADRAGALKGWLEDGGAVSTDAEVVNVLRVESGTPFFGVDFDVRNLPQEINRNDRAIHFKKGCYLGQETVARIDALGHVNRLLVGVRFAAPEAPPVGTVLVAGEREVGRVTSSVWSPRLESPLTLAMVRHGATAAGTGLDSTAGPAEVVLLPIPS
jgi:folate-binding protein YgfZ